ncbi:transcriptional regulator [Streptomyces sp. NPDC092296]|uniref:transcriptional regulator n=1 Tax=Streptomyces sp. NPDC092296 TaxID=3366012 RepID=UPI0037F1D720
MPRPAGNTALKAARQAAGYASQQALADALLRASLQLGLGQLDISVRQVRRWESAVPPWPRADHQRLLVHVLGLPLERLGFRPAWGDSPAAGEGRPPEPGRTEFPVRPVAPAALPRPTAASAQPSTIGADYGAITAAHRRLYWSVAPAQLHAAVAEHATLGTALLGETSGMPRRAVAQALAESLLLAGRIEFFDLRQPECADSTLVRALQAAGEADDPLLGSAILAHAAFVPGWAGRRDDSTERMVAARTYARRGPASGELWAWLDAVEAECMTRCGDHRTALHLLGHAENVLADGGGPASPPWLDWFSPARIVAFKGNVQLRAGHLPQARESLERALGLLGDGEGKQATVVLGDLAAVEVAARRPEEACARADQALDQLAVTWYATGMERVREVRRGLTPWAELECVRRLDDRLYGWGTTLSALQR